MKITIESDRLIYGPKTGVRVYLEKILTSLWELDTANKYSLVYFGKSKKMIGNLTKLPSNIMLKNNSTFPRKLYMLLLRTPFAPALDKVFREKSDLYLFPNFVGWPLSKGTKSVVIVYDTAYLDYPEVLETARHKRYLTKAVARSVRDSSHVIAISESTKQSLIKHYGLDKEKISVVTPAVDHTNFRPVSEKQITKIKQKYGITKNYILYLGSIEPRKNLASLAQAFFDLPQDLRQKYQLVLAGGESWGDTHLNEVINTQSDKSDVLVPGFIDEVDKPALYSGATVFVYPSLFEGWGMQVLESQACGTPVLCADNSSLPEVGGEAAIYVKTADQKDLSTKLHQLLTQPSRLDTASALGLAHAKKFTWQASAKKLLSILQQTSDRDN